MTFLGLAESVASLIKLFFIFLGVAASVASLIGVFFSFFAWRRARGAEAAAKEAREAVRQGNAAEAFQGLSVKAKDMLASLQGDNFQAASQRGRDLISEISQAKQRWEYLLEPASQARLDQTCRQVGRLSLALSRREADITPKAKERALKFCHEVTATLAEETGKILLLVDRG